MQFHNLTPGDLSRRLIQVMASTIRTVSDGSGQSAAAANTIQVTILYNFQPVTPLASIVGASSVHVEASTTMQVQKQQ